jgi:fatty acid desaturase
VKNFYFGLAFIPVVGVSPSWWREKHNRHHAEPNSVEHDPDVDFPMLAFSESQAASKGRIARGFVRYQAVLVVTLLFFEGLSMKLHSTLYLLAGGCRSRVRWLELALVVLHPVLLSTLLLLALPLIHAIIFLVVSQSVYGFYMGAVFAPNHKGMPMSDVVPSNDFLRLQVLTTRNVRQHPLSDFLYGGLNAQIEHHLFPSMPRNNLSQSRAVGRDFCAERGIDYHETGPLQSYREILSHLHAVGKSLKGNKAVVVAG